MKSSSFITGAQGLALASMVSGYIIGPLIILGGLGWYITKHSQNNWYLVIAVALAFILSNILIIKNTTKITTLLKKR